MEFLINHRANINNRSLIGAALDGHLSMVEYLVNHGASLHGDAGEQALIYAVANGHLPVVEFLINHGADIHARDDQAFLTAIDYDRFDVIEYLFSQGADINVLSPEKRQRYQHLLPIAISDQEYYQIEPNVERIKESPDRYLFFLLTGHTF